MTKTELTKRQLPVVKTDRQAVLFVKRADLAKYDLRKIRPMQFEFEAKETRVNMRLKKR